jgi:hypothetical protein
MKSTLTIDDKRWQEILELLPEIEGSSVAVGIQSDAGTGKEGTPIAAYAAWNEFGTRSAPARSFIRSTVDEKTAEWNKLADALISQMLALKVTPEQAFALLGEKAQADIKQKIISLREPPNDPSTINIKGSSNPLIDEGAMLGAVRYEVRMG